MRQHWVCAIVAALAVMLIGCPKDGVKVQPPTGTAKYSQRAQGLEKEYEPFLRAYSARDTARAEKEFAVFTLPDAKSWFAQYFAEAQVQQLVWDYESEVDTYRKSIINVTNTMPNAGEFHAHCLTKHGGTSTGLQPRSDAVLPGKSVPLEQFEIEFVGTGDARFSELANFVYVDGAYRYVGKGAYPFWSMPDATRTTK